MTLPAWPAELPLPLRDGYAAGRDDARVQRPADAGPPGYRRRFSSVAEPTQLQFDFNRAQLAIFDTFWRSTCAEGSLPFTMADPATDGWALLNDDGSPVLDEADAPVVLASVRVCLFGREPPSRRAYSNRFRVTVEVSFLP